MKLLEGKSVIVTGASSGIGLSAARLFARHGADLVLVARRKALLDEAVNALAAEGGRAIACSGDVTREETHASAVAAALETFGRLDGAFNNAGATGTIAPLADLSPAEWSETVSANLTSAFLAQRAQIPAMLASGGGALVFTGSFVGCSVGLPGMGAYAAAKAGLTGLVKSIAADYAARGIRANALLPGGVDTPMAGDEATRKWAAALHPCGRIAQPEEIARAALFLLSDMASFVSGSNLWADGGNSATKLASMETG